MLRYAVAERNMARRSPKGEAWAGCREASPGKPSFIERRGSCLMRARIYQPAKNAMQSGKARTKLWVLEYEPEKPRGIDPLMGWTSSSDMRQQIELEFATAEEAVAYAEKNAIPYQVFEPHKPAAKAKSYADNFRFDRKVPWSH
jgi:hypothetical protein